MGLKSRPMSQNLQTRYQDALDYLYQFVDFSLSHKDDLSLEDFTLESMRSLVDALGNPDRTYPTIHVAGTKGKGSVCALLATSLQEQGYKVGMYTSPHLKNFEERIQVDGKPISPAELVALVDEIKPYVEAIPDLTTFHITTALAFWYFARQNVDIAVIEVGLGGRLDSTNVITPIVSVITSLYLEHTHILGDTIEQIAAEKGGIIKPGVPVVVAPQVDSAREVIARIAAQKGSRLIQLGVDYHYRRNAASLDGQNFSVCNNGNFREELHIGLLGPHQVDNAAVAYVALQTVREMGIEMSEAAIAAGFSRTKWPGRFEVLRREPPVVVDSAHTPGAMTKLQETLDELFPGRPVWMVFGVSDDKDVEGMLLELKPSIRKVYCSRSTHPRALAPEVLVENARVLDVPVEAIGNVGDALETAMREAGEEAVVLVTGSIFVAATGRIAWFERRLWE
ncbi:MAG: bifunctional folylpolyglutamate synthase/dihydrofolate synthase [Chloroflexi bacterium]|nr:bifunctional folylpolyglutamate synthase/dihydrofolate synthase [Chloroflexota bacterium]